MASSRAARLAGLVALVLASACAAPEAPLVFVPMLPRSAGAGAGDAGIYTADPSPGPAQPPSQSRSVLGRWEGTGVQEDGTSWLMVVDISSLKTGPCATALYPTVPCSGTWTCLAESDGRSILAVERINEGRRECVDGGTMRMFLTADGALEWSWAAAGDTARARLRRTGTP